MNLEVTTERTSQLGPSRHFLHPPSVKSVRDRTGTRTSIDSPVFYYEVGLYDFRTQSTRGTVLRQGFWATILPVKDTHPPPPLC